MSRRRRTSNQVIDTSNSINNEIPGGITFNYSENFNRVIELNTENFQTWKRKVLYLLTINKLAKYVLSPTLKKLRKKDVKEDLSNYIEDQFDSSLVYEKGTTITDITNDITAKWMIINGLGDNTQKLIEGSEKTAYQIWKILQASFTKSPGRLKMEINQKLNDMKYNTNIDINIFIANLQNLIDELEKIDSDLSPSTKIGILNRSLLENIRWINVFQYSDWEKCCQYVKKVIPEIILSNLKESNNTFNNNNSNNKNLLFNLENKNNKNYRKNIKFKGKRYIRRNGKCNYCHRKGHYFFECKLRLKQKKSK